MWWTFENLAHFQSQLCDFRINKPEYYSFASFTFIFFALDFAMFY